MAKDERRTVKTTDRVNITADVATSGGTIKVKVPFVTGVLTNLSGSSAADLLHVEKRNFEEFNQQNFEQRMKSIKPTVECEVDDKIGGEKGDKLRVKIQFESLKDFEPGAVVRNVDPLRKLMFVRSKLKEILGNSAGFRDREKAVADLLSKFDTSEPARKLVEGLLKPEGK